MFVLIKQFKMILRHLKFAITNTALKHSSLNRMSRLSSTYLQAFFSGGNFPFFVFINSCIANYDWNLFWKFCDVYMRILLIRNASKCLV